MSKENQAKNKLDLFKEFCSKYMPKFLIGISIGFLVTILFIVIQVFNDLSIIQKQDPSKTFGDVYSILYFIDGSFIGGMIVIFIGLFSFVTNKGFFDIFAYNGVRFMNFLKQYKTKNIYGTYEYTKSKEEKRAENKFQCLSYIVAGATILLVSFICYFLK